MTAAALLLAAALALAAGEPAAKPEVTRVEVRVRLEVAVRVVGEDGAPAAGAVVFLEGEAGEPVLLEAGEDGLARGTVEVAEGGRARAAATSGDAWALTDWQSLETCRSGLRLALGPAGTLALESRSTSGAPTLETGGWELTRLLEMAGAGPEVYAGTPLLVAGLPAGDYLVTLGNEQKRVTLRPKGTVRVVFE